MDHRHRAGMVPQRGRWTFTLSCCSDFNFLNLIDSPGFVPELEARGKAHKQPVLSRDLRDAVIRNSTQVFTITWVGFYDFCLETFIRHISSSSTPPRFLLLSVWMGFLPSCLPSFLDLHSDPCGTAGRMWRRGQTWVLFGVLKDTVHYCQLQLPSNLTASQRSKVLQGF